MCKPLKGTDPGFCEGGVAKSTLHAQAIRLFERSGSILPRKFFDIKGCFLRATWGTVYSDSLISAMVACLQQFSKIAIRHGMQYLQRQGNVKSALHSEQVPCSKRLIRKNELRLKDEWVSPEENDYCNNHYCIIKGASFGEKRTYQ